MRRLLFLLVYFIWAAAAQAQEYKRREIDLDLFVQELFQVQDEDVQYEDIYETLFQYYRNPLNLNTASKEELSSLYVLSEMQIAALLAYMDQNGMLLSIYELQAVPTFDL